MKGGDTQRDADLRDSLTVRMNVFVTLANTRLHKFKTDPDPASRAEADEPSSHCYSWELWAAMARQKRPVALAIA